MERRGTSARAGASCLDAHAPSLYPPPTPAATERAAYSNPRGALAHAAAEGYAVTDYALYPLPFGRYSSQTEARRRAGARGARRAGAAGRAGGILGMGQACM
jgi:hypothetical protein